MSNATSFSTFSENPFDPSLLDWFVSGDSLPGRWFSGLYAMRDPNGNFLYIGQSRNVPDRIRDHRRERPWFREDTQVSVLPWRDPDTRLAAEAVLQLRYRPRWCQAIKLRIGKDGGLTEVSFIPTRRRRKS